MGPSRPTPFGDALHRAVAEVRARCGDPAARVAVVAPMLTNCALARRALAASGPFIRVDFLTPPDVVARLGRMRLARQGLRPEPAGWLEATVEQAIDALHEARSLGRFGDTLTRPGWAPTLARAVGQVESAELPDDALPRAGERGEIVARVLEAVRQARDAEGLYGAAELAAAARSELDDPRRLPIHDVAGVVVFGDGVLPYSTYEIFGAWLATRPGHRLAIAPFEAIDAAPLGLRRAAADLPTTACDCHGEGRLPELRRKLYRDGSGCTRDEKDETVTIAETPDEVREATEAVREVARAIDRGVPLDRIAIAVPDAATTDVLASALTRAGIDATWLTGPPLHRTADARFLVLAIAIAGGDDSVARWYELLSQPDLFRRGRLRAVDTRGRDRWRRILGRCGAVGGTDLILDALRAWRERCVADGARAAEAEATTSLLSAIELLKGELDALPRIATLGEHGKAWSALLRTYRHGSSERSAVLGALDAWGSPPSGTRGLGPALPRAKALSILRDTLASTAHLRGSLSDPAIRVAPPMALLGGEFDLVCVLGLNQGRFPRAEEEDVLLSDDTIAALNAAAPTPTGEPRLVDSPHLADAERRRFTAAIASCWQRLWLSVPRAAMAEGRPGLASALVLDLASCLAGERVRYGTLADHTRRTGHRGRFAPADPDDAVSHLEHLVARLDASPRDALPALAGHPTARRLLRLHLSVGRMGRATADAPVRPDGWTGLIAPEHGPTPILDGSAERPHVLGEAALRPGRYLFRRLLGAWKPATLPSGWDPTGWWVVRDRTFRALIEALDDGAKAAPGELMASFQGAWQRATEADGEFKPKTGESANDFARRLSDHLVAELVAGGEGELVPGPRRSLKEQAVHDDVPWVLMSDGAYYGEERLCFLSARKVRSRKSLHASDDFAYILQGLAFQAAGHPVRAVEIRDLEGNSRVGAVDEHLDEVRACAARAVRRAEHGFWPLGDAPDLLRFAAEAELADDAVDAILDAFPGAINADTEDAR